MVAVASLVSLALLLRLSFVHRSAKVDAETVLHPFGPRLDSQPTQTRFLQPRLPCVLIFLLSPVPYSKIPAQTLCSAGRRSEVFSLPSRAYPELVHDV